MKRIMITGLLVGFTMSGAATKGVNDLQIPLRTHENHNTTATITLYRQINTDELKSLIAGLPSNCVVNMKDATIIPSRIKVTAAYDYQTGAIQSDGKEVSLTAIHELPATLFYKSEVKEVILPDNLVKIGESMGWHSLEKLPQFPNTLRVIETGAFAGCDKMQGLLAFPDAIERVGGGAFSGCSLLSGMVSVPKSLDMLRSIGFLNGCSGLQGVRFPQESSYLFEGGFIQTKDRKSILSGAIPAQKRVVLPQTEEIYAGAFLRDEVVEEIVCPSKLKRIGKGAFLFCYQLKSILLPNGLEEIGEDAFNGCPIEELTIPATVKKIGASRWLELKSMNVLSSIPCEISEHNNPNNKLIVRVPKGAKSAYMQAKGWRQFKIEER